MVALNIFFISDKCFDGKVLKPRISKTIASHEDAVTKRICVSNSIKSCLNATLDTVCSHSDTIFAHVCYSDEVVVPSDRQVHDARVTGERWLLKPALFELYDEFKVKLVHMPRKNRLQYNFYGKRTGEHIIIYATNMFQWYGESYSKDLYQRVIW
jgi:hypothetical protein